MFMVYIIIVSNIDTYVIIKGSQYFTATISLISIKGNLSSTKFLLPVGKVLLECNQLLFYLSLQKKTKIHFVQFLQEIAFILVFVFTTILFTF